MESIADAHREWDDPMFWTEVRRAFAASPESAELCVERELWDSTVSDGFVIAPSASEPRASAADIRT
jgi:hypothetical protein